MKLQISSSIQPIIDGGRSMTNESAHRALWAAERAIKMSASSIAETPSPELSIFQPKQIPGGEYLSQGPIQSCESLLDDIPYAQRVCDTGERRVHRRARNKDAGVGDIEIVKIMRFAVCIDD